MWLVMGSFGGAFSGVLCSRAIGAWVVRRTFAELNRKMRDADEALTPVERPGRGAL